jgi:pyruvate dehydrogenase E1 component
MTISDEGHDSDSRETAEWLEAFEQLRLRDGIARAQYILQRLREVVQGDAGRLPSLLQTPYLNSIAVDQQGPYPGDLGLEKRIRAILRWNAAVLVHRAYVRGNHGGHIATYASAATLYEVGFNHFFRGGGGGGPRDFVFFQGHSAPGIYARAFLEGFLSEAQLDLFRHEAGGKGLPAFPSPRGMPEFWENANSTVGVGPLFAIYQARFDRYLRDRRLKDTGDGRVWAFVGDGECDDPHTLGSLSVAAREGLDNLVFVVNCNLQRVDGPVSGNFKIIQDLEAVFRGAGWNVLKVIWGSDWDPLLASDTQSLLAGRMEETVDGEYQKYSASPGSTMRKHFFGKHPQLLKLVETLTDDQLRALRRGGHDPVKVFAAYHGAVTRASGRPTAILVKTVKGWATGFEGTNQNHYEKRFKEAELRALRDRLQIPIPDERLSNAPYYRPPENSDELAYLQERRRALGGNLPRRMVRAPKEEIPPLSAFEDNLKGTSRGASTTSAFNSVLRKLLVDAHIGRRIVPILSDEARSFGLDPLFGALGIYNSGGQRYEPVDADRAFVKMHYRESKDGQVLEEGANRPGAIASVVAAGTSYATHGVNTIPMYVSWSNLVYPRVGELIWAAVQSRAKGFLLGGCAGRTTLSGEGVAYQDGQSILHFSTVPNCRVYDAGWAYEVAVIVHDGLRRMYQEQEDCLYYITVYNESYPHPPMPDGVEEGILKGLYRFLPSPLIAGEGREVQLLGSGAILPEVVRAQQILADKFGVAATVWSATSYGELRRDALDCEAWNLHHPQAHQRVPYAVSLLGTTGGPIVAATDFVRSVPELISRWFPDRFLPLGTDGFGFSDMRSVLRRHFGVDAESIAWASLVKLTGEGKFPSDGLKPARKELGLELSG